MEPIYEKVTGICGIAEPVDIPDTPKAAETVAHWLLTSELGNMHPLFDQWVLLAVRLRDNVPGFPPPHRQFPGATHEILCITLNPEAGHYTPERILSHMETGGMPHLSPPNVIVQVEATDDEVRPLVSLLAQAVVHGALVTESAWTAGHDNRLNEEWLTSITKSLAHQRGEIHAP
jgi:hypothetical protein